MELSILVLLPVLVFGQYQQGVRVAPGVPPQHYQGPPGGNHGVPQQQFQQQQHGLPPGVNPQHYQGGVPQHQVPGHVPQHLPQQHVPQGHVPQQQVHVPQGHVPQGHGGQGHAHDHENARLLDASNVMKERSHIQEHMDVPLDTSQMTEQELQFHYFKMHDADNNNKLDGCELVKSLIHWHDSANHNPNSGHPVPEPKIFKDEELIQMIDPILQNDDLNRDGQIDYMEFSQAQKNAAARAGTGA